MRRIAVCVSFSVTQCIHCALTSCSFINFGGFDTKDQVDEAVKYETDIKRMRRIVFRNRISTCIPIWVSVPIVDTASLVR